MRVQRSETIQATFVATSQRQAEHLLNIRQLYIQAEQKNSEYLQKSRTNLAKKLLILRQKIRNSAVKAAEKQADLAKASELLRYQERYNLQIKQLEDKAVTVAKQMAEEVIEQELQTNQKCLLKKIQHELSRLCKVEQLCVTISDKVSAEVAEQLNNLITPFNGKICRLTGFSLGDVLIKTVAGTISLNIKDHIDSLKTLSS